jgi:phosphate-selective porin
MPKFFKIVLVFIIGLVLSVSLAFAQEKKEEKKPEKKEEKKEEAKPNVFSSAASKVTVDGYFQLQYSTTTVDRKDDPETADKNEGIVSNSFEVRRARLGIRANFTDWITGRLQIDAVASQSILRDAYLDLAFDKGFELRFGQFKKPFSRIQLLSSSVFPMIERGIRIRGVSNKALDNSLEDLKFSERDIGIMAFGNFKDVMGKDTSLGYQVAVVNGAGRNVTPDTNNGKLINARITVAPTKGFELAASFSNNSIPTSAP